MIAPDPFTEVPLFELGPYQTLHDGVAGSPGSLALRLDELENDGAYQKIFAAAGVELDLEPRFSFNDPHFLLVARGSNADIIRGLATQIVSNTAWYREAGEVGREPTSLIYAHLGSYSPRHGKLFNACTALSLEPAQMPIFDYLVTGKAHPVYTADVSDILVVSPQRFDEMKTRYHLEETLIERERTQNFSRGFRVLIPPQP